MLLHWQQQINRIKIRNRRSKGSTKQKMNIRYFSKSLAIGLLTLLLSSLSTVSAQPTAQVTPPSADASVYTDNRSTAASLILSYYNAINRKEYVRAYSYWDGTPAELQPFPQYAAGFANTTSAQVTIGIISTGVGAGQIYYSVPVTLVAQLTNSITQIYVGCFTLHLANPAIQAAPPFTPLGISSAHLSQVGSTVNSADLMTRACPDQGNQPLAATPDLGSDPQAIDAARYIDDRSDPVAVLRSLFNALNRKEYARAYSYWDTVGGIPAQLPAFDQFQQGYSDTASARLIAGIVTSDAGAGQLNYSVPVTLLAQTTAGATRIFVGCYQLHLSQPAIQGIPPFRPLGITGAQIKQVPNDSNTAALMGQSCAL